ncbi:MAG: wax ester/triacylglycerol synthase family O-acyltransferase [Comamonadaceae bacterium]|nr:wax ester/triacylglycerol synthase family O-acyltransferase [Comamonadaceae bacterium]
MLAGWGRHLSALPPFNQRPVLRRGLWYWEDDTEFELDYHLRHLALPHPGRIRELLAMISRLHGNLLDRNRPLWEAYVIEGLPQGRFATYTKIHHALVDGVTGARIMAESLARTADEDKPPVWAQVYSRHPTVRREAPAKGLIGSASAARAGRDILPGVAGGLWDIVRAADPDSASALPFHAPPTPFNVEISGSRRFAAQSYSLARLKRIGEAAGATVNDVTLAICAGALRRYLEVQKALPRKPLIAMVPVSLHGETDAGGNQVSLLLANLATNLRDPLRRLQRIVQSTTQPKEAPEGDAAAAEDGARHHSISPMGAGMVMGTSKQRPGFNVVISNVPGPETHPVPQRRAAGRGLSGLHCDALSCTEHHDQRLRRQPGLWLHCLPAIGAGVAAHAGLHR